MENNIRRPLRCNYIEHLILQLLDFVKEYQPCLLSFPLNIKNIIELLPMYRVWTYKDYSSFMCQTMSQTERLCQSKTGCTFCNANRQYMILYNDDLPIGRQNFTLAHELGHCILSHFIYSEMSLIAENGTGEYVDHFIEQEADYFASTLLCPLPICKKLHVQSPVDIQHIFGLSGEASFYQYNKYLVWQDKHFKTAFDTDIANYFVNHPRP